MTTLWTAPARILADQAEPGWEGIWTHLTATKTRYPGADLILRYEIKDRA